jgi:nucleotide-binding universal stress UspA family protein
MPPEPDTTPSAEERAGRAAQRHVRALAERAGLVIDTRTLHGQVADRLLTVARECRADLVVVGRQDRPGVRLTHVGRTAEQVLEFSAVPVLVVPMPRPRTAGQVVDT